MASGRVAPDFLKNEDYLVQDVIVFKYRIQYSPENIQGAVV